LLIYASKILDFAKFSVFSITSGVAFALAKNLLALDIQS